MNDDVSFDSSDAAIFSDTIDQLIIHGKNSVTSATSAPTHPRELIAYLAERKIRGFCGTIDDQGEYLCNVYKENRSLSAHVTADYHGRFLIELIQNANDIHPRDRLDGEIEILLDAKAGHETLYVANRGGNFKAKNVNALCDIGMSSKPPGEAIGNKGLGFRSVHHITDTPEIYSQAEPISAKPAFDGFCFSFADESDLDRLLLNPRHRELASQDLPLFHIPRWLPDQPETVLNFAARGFSTVIRLPLRDSNALQAAYDELTKLQAESAPMLLFLKRLGQLTVRIVNSEKVDDNIRVILQRKETQLPASRYDLSLVDLGFSGTFLIARRAVAENQMKEAVHAGVVSKQLHPSWEDWKGNGEVAVGVRLDSGPISPRLYTFLPMGKEAVAPFNGFLHGTFFPTSNRKALDTGVELNRLMLMEAASLAADVAAYLAGFFNDLNNESNRLLDEASAARAAIDLLVWQKVSSLESDSDLKLPAFVASKTASAFGVASLDDAPVIPCLGIWTEKSIKPPYGPIVWRRAHAARHWESELSTFTVDVIAKHGTKVGIAPLWLGLGTARIKALTTYLADNMDRYQSQLTPSERSGIVASVAADIHKEKRLSPAQWMRFYLDLLPFMGNDITSLAGLKILLCGDGSLRSTIKQAGDEGEIRTSKRRRRKDIVSDVSVFAPPAPKGTKSEEIMDGELSPPAALKQHFAFLSEALPWYDELASVRSVLEGKLFYPFDSDVVLTRLSQVLVRNGLKETYASGLRWAFHIWRRAHENNRPIQMRSPSPHRFFVPTISGSFIEAHNAIFSATWAEETEGKRLQTFLDLAPSDCEDLNDVRSRRLAPITHRVFGKTRRDLWVSFLTELGVQRGLEPIEKKVAIPIRASDDLANFRFCKALGISDAAVTVWKDDITNEKGGINFYYSTEYVIKGRLWWMPGQGDHERFSNDCRELYAALIVRWFGRAKPDCWTVEIHHHYVKSDTRRWPTPLASFIRSAKWIPTDELSTNGTVRGHFAPKDIWLSSHHGSERFPPFLRRPTWILRRAFERDQSVVKELMKRGRLRILHDPATTIEQASFLAEQYRSGHVDRYHEREFINLYHRTWSAIASQYHANEDVIAPTYIVGRRGSAHVIVDLDNVIDLLYVRDTEDETVPGLIEAIGGILFDVRSSDPARVGSVLKAFYGAKVRLVSEVRCELLVGTTPISEITCEQTITTVCPWLRAMTAVSLEALRAGEFQRLPLDRSVIITRLERVAFLLANHIGFRIDGKEIPSVDTSRQAFALKTGEGRAIVVALHEGEVTWAAIEASLQAICEAIEQPGLVPHMRLLARELAAAGEHVDAEPLRNIDIDRLCKTLFLDRQVADAVHQTLGADLKRFLPWLRAIIHLSGGDAAFTEFSEIEEDAIRDIGKLRIMLSPLVAGLGLDADRVLDACKDSFNVGEFRESLGLNFANFNMSLKAVGEEADVDPEYHRVQLANFLAEHEIAIIDSLRNAFASILVSKKPAPDYVRLRESLSGLSPDPDWLILHQHLPKALLDGFLENWLQEAGAPPIGDNPFKLPALQSVRAFNQSAVKKFAEKAAPLVRVWCVSNARAIPDFWRDASAANGKLREKLDKAGAFDFLPFDDEAALLEWLSNLAVWPEGMPLTLDRKVLGVNVTEVEIEQQKVREERAAREAQERSVTFNGRQVDPRSVDWDVISEEIRSGLSRTLLSTSVESQADLSFIKRSDQKSDSDRKSGKNSGRGISGEASNRVPQEKKDMIGRLGEIVVYHWLKERLPKQDIDKAWKSENATRSIGREGKDGLGYDFEIMYRNQSWQIEVKASVGDPLRFEMGETEVRAARHAARPRSGIRYMIAYVSYVGEPSKTWVEMLPNPMTDDGANVLEILGEGIRYGFRRENH